MSPADSNPALSRRIAVAAMAHAAACAPRESCGVVTGGRYVAQDNVAPDPEAGFRIADRDMADACAAGLEAVIHSHPHPHPPCPSHRDQVQQLATAVPWAIVPVGEDRGAGQPVWWGPGVAPPPLIGRPYRWGVTDCYSAVRDWFAIEREIALPDFAREWGWWNRRGDNPDLFERHFAEAGGVPVPLRDARPGDVLLMQIGARCISHCGVIAAPGLMLHHPAGARPYDPGQLSRREPVARYRPFIRRAVRHGGSP